MNKRDSEKREDIASCLELLALFRQLLPEEQRKALELLRTLTEQAEETYSTQTDARARPGPAGGRRAAPLSRSIREHPGRGAPCSTPSGDIWCGTSAPIHAQGAAGGPPVLLIRSTMERATSTPPRCRSRRSHAQGPKQTKGGNREKILSLYKPFPPGKDSSRQAFRSHLQQFEIPGEHES